MGFLILCDSGLRVVMLYLVHDDIVVEIVANPLRLIQVSISKEISSEKQSKSKQNSQKTYEQNLLMVVISQTDIGIDIVIVKVGNSSDDDD